MNKMNNAIVVKKEVQKNQAPAESIFVKMSRNFDKAKTGQDRMAQHAGVANRTSGVYAY